MKLALKLLIAGAGLALFAWFVHRAGVDTISHAFVTLGWSAPLILLPFTFVYFLDTLGWRFAFGSNLPKGIGFRNALPDSLGRRITQQHLSFRVSRWRSGQNLSAAQTRREDT